MKTLLVPLGLGLIGLGVGAGAGWMLRPPPDPVADAVETPLPAVTSAELEAMRLPQHFVVPVLADGRVQSMMVLSVALELRPGHGLSLAKHEPRMRALFLQVLFDHANQGGFEGVFTSGEALIRLRRTLRDAARAEYGDAVHDVLITEILRQGS